MAKQAEDTYTGDLLDPEQPTDANVLPPWCFARSYWREAAAAFALAERMMSGKRGRGRPRKPNALTPAERARRYRQRKKAATGPN